MTAKTLGRLRHAPHSKAQSLIEGLMVRFADNAYAGEDAARAEAWLRENPDRWDRDPAWSYIRDRVRAKLGM